MSEKVNEIERLLQATKFASIKHTGQTRKGADGAPYVNHVIEVAETLSTVGGVADVDILVAALLHDTVEDTETTPAEIEEKFGSRVRRIVEEVTDDKSLPKERRKELQVEHAPHMSVEAKQLKIADKTSNVREIVAAPPDGWSHERRSQYLKWAEDVMTGLRGSNPALEANFDRVLAGARQQLTDELHR